MTEYDDYVGGSVDREYEKWLKKNLPEHLLTEEEKQEGWDFATEVTIASLVEKCKQSDARADKAERINDEWEVKAADLMRERNEAEAALAKAILSLDRIQWTFDYQNAYWDTVTTLTIAWANDKADGLIAKLAAAEETVTRLAAESAENRRRWKATLEARDKAERRLAAVERELKREQDHLYNVHCRNCALRREG